METKGMLIVISGFSGVGKGTVVQLVFDALPELRFSVSCTTRAPRKGEKDGESYYFITEDEFALKAARGEFAEYTHTFLNGYGTLKSEIEGPISKGTDVVLELNVVGARAIKEQYPDSVTIFITPPSIEALKARLIGRGTESADSIERRLNEIDTESKAIAEYDYVVTNDVASDCANRIVEIIRSERAKRLAKI